MMSFSPVGIILAGVPAASRRRIGPIAASGRLEGHAGRPDRPEDAETPPMRNWGVSHTMRFWAENWDALSSVKTKKKSELRQFAHQKAVSYPHSAPIWT